jgi:UDP-2-acetamido-3-amino-2,3-dideoxy-glucuronate N-acetyltransferase
MQELACIHASADVSPQASVGEGPHIGNTSGYGKWPALGEGAVIGKGVHVSAGVSTGDCVKVQNYAPICEGVTPGDGVFVGPHVCFTNDLRPRA